MEKLNDLATEAYIVQNRFMVGITRSGFQKKKAPL